ncbi:hypothetical protein [Limnohabitans sp. Rim8]|uniref:hypothetical protein n=1 Tax=Limnohabitans sp. Rim8 TaxID=1100718 RepID=UPI003306713C
MRIDIAANALRLRQACRTGQQTVGRQQSGAKKVSELQLNHRGFVIEVGIL